MGKELEKEWIYIPESLCCTSETQHCKSTTLQYKIKKFKKKGCRMSGVA